MAVEYFEILIPLIGLVMNLLCQVIIIRYIKKTEMLKSIIGGFFIGLVSVICLELLTQRKLLSVDLATNLFIYISLGYCYFHFINLCETARRIRILTEIYNSTNGLSIEGILNRYNSKSILQVRLNRLVRSNQIIESMSKYYISSWVMSFSSKIMNWLKFIILGKSYNRS